MIPTSSRQVIVALSTIFLLGFLWYKRKRNSERSDPGGTGIVEVQKRSCLPQDCLSSEPEAPVVQVQERTVSVGGLVNAGSAAHPEDTSVIVEDLPGLTKVEGETFVEKPVQFSDLPHPELSAKVVCADEAQSVGCEISIFEDIEEEVREGGGDNFPEGETIEKHTECEVVEEKCMQMVTSTSEAAVQLSDENKQVVEEVPIVQKIKLNPNAEHFTLSSRSCESSAGVKCKNEIVSGISNKVESNNELLATEDCNGNDRLSDCVQHLDTAEIKLKDIQTVESAGNDSCTVDNLNDSGAETRWSSECESSSKETIETDSQTNSADSTIDSSSEPAAMARESKSDVECETPHIEDNVAERKHENGPSCLGSKLSALKLEECSPKDEDSPEKTKAKESSGVERDSANHSPADVMLESPTLNNYSDVQSEGSSDSGKGGSDVATPPSRTPASGSSVAGDLPPPSVYEFVLPQLLVGRLIGRHGIVVQQIKAKTNANIFIKRHPETIKMKICAIEGTPMDIESALEMIRQKFPQKRFPNVTLEQVSFLPPVTTFPLASEYFQLPLIEGVNNDVIVSSLVTPEHCFLQQPTHPTYLALGKLNMFMNMCYNEPNSPLLPLPVKEDVVCVAPTMGGWFRAQVVAAYPENETCDVRFLDYGGYLNLAQTDLRQIRQDFLTLPFQAAECYLANVKPVNGVWMQEAVALFEQLTHGQVIQAQIHGYADNGIPVVYLFSIQTNGVVVVNQELVSRGYAELYEPAELVDAPGAQKVDTVGDEEES